MKDPSNWVKSKRNEYMMGDMLLDLDYALSQIGVHHREMELADAYYMVEKYNNALKKSSQK